MAAPSPFPTRAQGLILAPLTVNANTKHKECGLRLREVGACARRTRPSLQDILGASERGHRGASGSAEDLAKQPWLKVYDEQTPNSRPAARRRLRDADTGDSADHHRAGAEGPAGRHAIRQKAMDEAQNLAAAKLKKCSAHRHPAAASRRQAVSTLCTSRDHAMAASASRARRGWTGSRAGPPYVVHCAGIALYLLFLRSHPAAAGVLSQLHLDLPALPAASTRAGRARQLSSTCLRTSRLLQYDRHHGDLYGRLCRARRFRTRTCQRRSCSTARSSGRGDRPRRW